MKTPPYRDLSDKPRIVVTNPEATRAWSGDEIKDIFGRGFFCDTIETTSPDFDKNVRQLAKKLPDGALVFVNGGDGTVTQVASAILARSSDDPSFIAPLRRGNFNDAFGPVVSREMLQQPHLQKVYPLEVTAYDSDGEIALERKALLYMTLGMMANFAEELSRKGSRDSMKNHSHLRRLLSLSQAGLFWLNHRSKALPPSFWSDSPDETISGTDIVFANNPRVAGIVEVTDYRDDPKLFGRGALDLSTARKALETGLQGLLSKVPTEPTTEARLCLRRPTGITIHHDGEVAPLLEAITVSVKKCDRSVVMVA